MNHGELLVLPINFRWYEHSVVFRLLEGHKLAAAAEQQHVCFEVDDWDADTGYRLERGGARCWLVMLTHWCDLGADRNRAGEWRPIWVRIEPTMISGRLLR